jgi:hypothetical protein
MHWKGRFDGYKRFIAYRVVSRNTFDSRFGLDAWCADTERSLVSKLLPAKAGSFPLALRG